MIELYQPIIFGDPEQDGGRQRFAGQTLSIHLPDPGATQTVVGDAFALTGMAIGGSDTLACFAFTASVVIGDAVTLAGRARGGHDNVIATSSISAFALGDAVLLKGRSSGGDDSVDVRGDGATAYGDAYEMNGRSRGGDDIVTGAAFPLVATQLFGDAQTLADFALGGNDTLFAIVQGSGPGTMMFGDGAELLDRTRGGNDTLVSAANGNETMWGDAAVVAPTAHTGADTFVFLPSNGKDTIMDFEPGNDKIELNGFGFDELSDFTDAITYTEQGAVIALDDANSILVVGVTGLGASDFILS